MSETIAIIAGSGRFPFDVAQEARRQGVETIVIGLQGWADAALAAQMGVPYEEVAVGQLGRLMASLKAHGARQAIMAGKVTKEVLLDPRATFDAETLSILSQVRDVSVGSLLGAVAQRLAKEGITLLDSSTFLRANLCPVGVLTARGPTPREQADIAIGMQAARAIAALDIGQTVMVKERVVVAVEALEGTDAAIQRASILAGPGLVVVKTASPNHDRRFDLPIIGLNTIETLTQAHVTCVAVEAGVTILLDRATLLAAANKADLCVVGMAVDDSTS